MAEPTDAQLMAQARAGGDACEDAFALIYRRHVDAVAAYMANRADRDVARELYTEVFKVAFSRLAVYDAGQGSVRAWLKGIADNLLSEEARRRKREREALDRVSAEPEVPPKGVEAVDDMLYLAWAAPRIAALVDALPAGERRVVRLRFFRRRGRTYREIAAELGIPIGTVGSRLSSATKRLRQGLSDESPPSDPHAPKGGTDE